MEHPGMTELKEALSPTEDFNSTTQSKIIFIATENVNYSKLFQNGLLQNILIFYKLFQLLNYTPYLIVNSPISESTSDLLISENYLCMLPEEVPIKNIIPHIYIEMSATFDNNFINYLRKFNTKIINTSSFGICKLIK